MMDIYQNYCDPSKKNAVARFVTIYIAEAHPRDEWWLPDAINAKEGQSGCILQHKNIDNRIQAAKTFVKDFNVTFEVVCDSMKNHVYDVYNSWPERLYIIEKGVIVYEGGIGPFHYKLAEVKDWLSKRYGLRGEVVERR